MGIRLWQNKPSYFLIFQNYTHLNSHFLLHTHNLVKNFHHALQKALFAETLFDLGLPGLTLMLILVAITLRKSIWMIRNAPTESTRINSVLLFGIWLCYALFAAKQYNLWTGFPFFFISIVINKCALVAQKEWPALEDIEYKYDDDDDLEESSEHHDARFS